MNFPKDSLLFEFCQNCIRAFETIPDQRKTPLFSKKYDSPPKPTENFIAILVCSDADQTCPIISGAQARFALPFQDPKISDDREDTAVVYDQSLAEIGRDFFYAIHRAKAITKDALA